MPDASRMSGLTEQEQFEVSPMETFVDGLAEHFGRDAKEVYQYEAWLTRITHNYSQQSEADVVEQLMIWAYRLGQKNPEGGN